VDVLVVLNVIDEVAHGAVDEIVVMRRVQDIIESSRGTGAMPLANCQVP